MENKLDWTPKTKLGRQVLKGTYNSLEEVLKNKALLELGVVDHFNEQFSTNVVSVDRISHSLRSGKIYSFRVTVLVGKEGMIGCGVGKSNIKSVAIKKALNRAKQNLVYLGNLKRQSYYTPRKVGFLKKGATLITVSPLEGRSVTASKLGQLYCNMCNLKGIKITVGSKKRNVKGKVGSKLNYFTALHEIIGLQVSDNE